METTASGVRDVGRYVGRADSDKVWNVLEDAPSALLNITATGTHAAGNWAAIRYDVDGPSSIETVYHKTKSYSDFARLLQDMPRDFAQQSRAFRRRIAATFPITTPKDPSLFRACKFALSNLLGSISYFYGTSFYLQDNMIEKRVVESEPFELFTDIPSRATFPRGFLWYAIGLLSR